MEYHGVTNVTPPPEPIYREDPTLPTGTIKQVDWAVNGASVSVQRNVYKDGSLYFTDYIHTTYVPWPDGIIMVQAQILATAKLGEPKPHYGKIYPP